MKDILGRTNLDHQAEREPILKILGKYKVIGDTTYGLGFEEANELADELLNLLSLNNLDK